MLEFPKTFFWALKNAKIPRVFGVWVPKHTGYSGMSGFLSKKHWILQRVCSAVLGARKAATKVCTMTVLAYRTTTQRQSLTAMAQTERAANQGPAKLRLENNVFVINNSPKINFRNLLRDIFIIFSRILLLQNKMR